MFLILSFVETEGLKGWDIVELILLDDCWWVCPQFLVLKVGNDIDDVWNFEFIFQAHLIIKDQNPIP